MNITIGKKTTTRKQLDLKIHKSIFEDGKLKFIKKTDWSEAYFILKETEKPEENDLPF